MRLGLMIGIELKQKVQDKLAELLQHHIIALPAGPNVIRMLPPLARKKKAGKAGLFSLSQILMIEKIRPHHLFSVCCGIALLFSLGVNISAEVGGDIEYAEIQPLAVESLLLDVVRIGDRLVAAGERGHIIYSDDGHDWVQSTAVPTLSTINKLFVLDNRLWAAGHDSVILTSADRGKTWTHNG